MPIKPDYRNPSSKAKAKSPARQKKERDKLASEGAYSWTDGSAEPLNTMIVGASLSVYNFFHDNGYMIIRDDWKSSGINPALAAYVGWIYAFYGDGDTPLYIGETKRAFGTRFKEHQRKKQKWWPHWTRVKVLPCPNQSVRKIFESLIGLAGGYIGNRAQPEGVDDLFTDIILSLTALGNDAETKPIFNNETVSGYAALSTSF